MSRKKHKQRYSVLGAVFALVSIVVLLGVGISKTHLHHDTNTEIKPLDHKDIAIIAALDLPAMQELITGFKDFISSQYESCSFKTYYYNLDSALLKQQVNDAIDRNVDAILAIGNNATRIANRIVKRRNPKIPLVGSSIAQPIDLGISDDGIHGHDNVSATVNVIAEDTENIKKMVSLRPDMRTAMVIYNAADINLERCKDQLVETLNNLNIKTIELEVFLGDNVINKASGLLSSEVDAIFILRDYVAIEAAPALVKLCNTHGMTFFAHDSESVKVGAAAGFCGDEYKSGMIAGELLNKALQGEEFTRFVTLTTKMTTKFLLNLRNWREQKVSRSLAETLQLENVEVVRNS